jgi:hypothetical protein
VREHRDRGEKQGETKRDKESLRESLRDSGHIQSQPGLGVSPLFTSLLCCKVVVQKLQELDDASPPRARLSSYPFSIEHGHQIADLLIGQATLLFQRFIQRLDYMPHPLLCRLLSVP